MAGRKLETQGSDFYVGDHLRYKSKETRTDRCSDVLRTQRLRISCP